jgi:hypothetical protein
LGRELAALQKEERDRERIRKAMRRTAKLEMQQNPGRSWGGENLAANGIDLGKDLLKSVS